MTNAQKAIFLTEMTRLQSAYRQDLDKLSLRAYKDALDGRNIERFPEVTVLLIQEEKFFPPAAVIIKYFQRLRPISVPALPEAPMTSDQEWRTRLIRHYCCVVCIREDINPDHAMSDAYIAEHWDDDREPFGQSQVETGKASKQLGFQRAGNILDNLDTSSRLITQPESEEE